MTMTLLESLQSWVEEFDLKGSVLDRAFLSNQLIEPMSLQEFPHIAGPIVCNECIH